MSPSILTWLRPRTNHISQEINFVTFGSTPRYGRALKRIKRQARSLRVFRNVWAWTQNDLDASFREHHAGILRDDVRGYGYWIWKPQVILQALARTYPGGHLVYADAGCTLHAHGVHRLRQYTALATSSPIGLLAFDLGYPELMYTKMDTVHAVLSQPPRASLPPAHPATSDYGPVTRAGQVCATAHIWHNIPAAHDLAARWLYYCTKDNYRYANDIPSVLQNSAEFRDHRHDQSIFSLLAKSSGATIIPDETWHAEWPEQAWPIHASRIRDR